jgi:hypothetical protein
MPSPKRYLAVVILATAALGTAILVRARTTDSEHAPRQPAGEPTVAPESPRPPAPPPASVKPSPPPRPTEAAVMTKLRDLSGTHPELSLKLARDGNREFANGPGEAERRWYVVRSLIDLGRRDEARAEARVLIDRYPTSDWAQDVHRHLFVNPPTDPAERGYGKTLELE